MTLATKTWSRVSIHRVVLSWLRAERHTGVVKVLAQFPLPLWTPGLSKLLDQPSLDDAEENRARLRLLYMGRDLYADACAACHGRDMVNAGGIAFDLRKFPKDDFARFRTSVLNGKNQAMPAWRDKIDDNDLAALWAYVRSGG
jgi:mono/diheme cytochrome c family protein